MSEVLDLAAELINIESVTGNEKGMCDWLENWCQRQGLEVVRQTVAPDRDNLFAKVPGVKARLLFNSHIDTVPPFFEARFEGGRLMGRGACDTKSLIAAQLLAARRLLAEKKPIGLLYVVGEEVDHCGMIKANELGLDPEFLIVGEPTESKLANRQKGMLKIRLKCQGKAAHSGYPELGVSAITLMLDVLADLNGIAWPNDETLGQTTMNIGVLKGGRAANVVPDYCEAECLVRVVTDHRSILETITETIANRAKIEVVAGNDPTDLSVVDGMETSVVSFNTDIPYFNFSGKAFLWGAGSILDAHTDHEFIETSDLEHAVTVYEQLARQLLA